MRVRLGILVVLAAALCGIFAPRAGADCSTSACRADVGIWGSAQPSPITPARSSSSEIYLYGKDNGPNSAYGVTIHATVPSQLRIEFARDYSAQGPCTVKGTFVSCYLGDMKREQEGVVVIKVHPTGRQGTYEIPAHVYSQGVDDPNGGNNQVTATLHVYPKGHGG